MRTSVVAVYRWTWGIWCVYSLAIPVREVHASIGPLTAKVAERATRRVRFASPAVTDVIQVYPTTASSPPKDAAPPGMILSGDHLWSVPDTPREPVNATALQPPADGQSAGPAQMFHTWGLFGAPPAVKTQPLLLPIQPMATGLQDGNPSGPSGHTEPSIPVLLGAYAPGNMGHQVLVPAAHFPSPYAAAVQPGLPDASRGPGVVQPYILLTHQPVHNFNGVTGTYPVAPGDQAEGTQAPQSSFVLPRKTAEQVDKEVEMQERLRRARRNGRSRATGGVMHHVTNALAAVGAVYAASKAFKTVGAISKWIIPSARGNVQPRHVVPVAPVRNVP